MNEQKNLIAVIALTAAILFGFSYLKDYIYPPQPQQNQSQTQQQNTSSPKEASALWLMKDRTQALKESPRLPIKTPLLEGSVNLQGGRLDDLQLSRYHTTPDPASPALLLLNPSHTKDGYYVDFSWISSDNLAANTLPDSNTVWTTDATVLETGRGVTLKWDNGQGLLFERLLTIDDAYMFKVVERVTNQGDKPITLSANASIVRQGTPEVGGYMVLHEGLIGYLQGKLNEIDYKKLLKEKQIAQTTQGGWLGITDKYWLVSLIPAQNEVSYCEFNATPLETAKDSSAAAKTPGEIFSVQSKSDPKTVKPGETISYEQHLFAGAKILRLLDKYEVDLKFTHFDLAVDFGWFYFLTKPLFYFLDFLHKLLGNFGMAILVMTVASKVILFPFAKKSARSMARMKTLQPQIERIKARYGDDKVRINQELMALYRREKASPMSGCLPILVQAPIFFCLYKVLFVTIEMRHAPFYGWIQDLSVPDPTTIFNLFGLIPWTPPSFFMIGAWPIIMGLTMYWQQKMNPPSADPAQARIMLLMPIFLTYLLAQFPAGLVIYWAWSNILGMGQQWLITALDKKSR